MLAISVGALLSILAILMNFDLEIPDKARIMNHFRKDGYSKTLK